MTAIKHALQRDIFTPNDERLLCIVNVCKAGKKKKNCFLCATGRRFTKHTHTQLPTIMENSGVCLIFCGLSVQVTTERPVQVKVVKVKKSDKGDFYKRQQTWELRDLTEVDAKDASKVRKQMCRYFLTHITQFQLDWNCNTKVYLVIVTSKSGLLCACEAAWWDILCRCKTCVIGNAGVCCVRPGFDQDSHLSPPP